MISNRGVKVWPGGHAETFCSDHWRCRFVSETAGETVSHAQVISLISRVAGAGLTTSRQRIFTTSTAREDTRWIRESSGRRDEVAQTLVCVRHQVRRHGKHRLKSVPLTTDVETRERWTGGGQGGAKLLRRTHGN